MKIIYLSPWLPTSLKKRSGIFIAERFVNLVQKNHDCLMIYTNFINPPLNLFFPIPSIIKILKHIKLFLNVRVLYPLDSLNTKVFNVVQLPIKYGWPSRESILFLQIGLKFKKIINEFKPDAIIVSRVIPEGLFTSFFNNHVKCPVLVIAEGDEILLEPKYYNNWEKKVEKINHSKHMIICPGKDIYNKLPLLGFNVKRKIIHNGYNSKIFQFYPRLNNWCEFRIVSVGRLHRVKGYEILLKALSDFKINFRLTIIGSGDSKYKKELITLIEKANMGGKVVFISDMDQNAIYEILKQNDIFCLPSVSESFGIAAIEALGTGLPVISSKVGILKDYIVNGKNGYLFDIKDSVDLRNKLLLASKKKWDRKMIAVETYNTFSWSTWADEMIKTVNEARRIMNEN